MLEVLQFALSSFWRFAGTFILILAIGEAAAQIVKAFRR